MKTCEKAPVYLAYVRTVHLYKYAMYLCLCLSCLYLYLLVLYVRVEVGSAVHYFVTSISVDGHTSRTVR